MCRSDVVWTIVAQLRDNLKDCSCWSCRNPRTSQWLKYKDQITIQEHRENHRFTDTMKDIDNSD